MADRSVEYEGPVQGRCALCQQPGRRINSYHGVAVSKFSARNSRLERRVATEHNGLLVP